MFSNIRCTIARPARLEHNFGMRSTSNITWIVSSQHVFCPIVRSLGEIMYTVKIRKVEHALLNENRLFWVSFLLRKVRLEEHAHLKEHALLNEVEIMEKVETVMS